MPITNSYGQNYANLQNVWHHNNYITKYNIINHPNYPFIDNSIINSPNPTGWGQYFDKNYCGCNIELKSSMVENMCSSCSCGTALQLDQTAETTRTTQTEQSEQISNEMNAIKATTKMTNQTQNTKQKKRETYFSPLTHDFCNATKGGKKLAF
jgi:L-lactate utilization protein LutB